MLHDRDLRLERTRMGTVVVMKQAANLKNFEPGLLLPGIAINTSPTDFAPIEQLQLMKFVGQTWQLFGDVFSGQVEG